MVSNQQFRLKWNNHRNTVFNEFETLLHNNSFVDCTIGADGKYLKAHKIVLSACSPYLQNVFSEHFDKHPVILLKDVSFKELKCMIDYMYCGEVNISECELPSFLRTAQSLKIKGLAEDINNDYDSTSDSEQQEVGSFSENGRTIEANVEIHDDDGPPAKKSTPSLVSTSVNNSFTGRKRKTPAAGKITSQNKIAPINTSNTRKCADINVPNTVNKTENSDNTLCSTTKENCVKQDETNDNNRKISSQNDTQELVNSRTEVKEELVDTDADNDDNSSYECMNNPCEDSDPLNEDSESNCTNTGNKFSEVSIASLSSYNENDGPFKIKEEAFHEVVIIPDQLEQIEDKLLSEEISNDLASYCISENEDELRNSIIVEVRDYETVSRETAASDKRKPLLRKCKNKPTLDEKLKVSKLTSSINVSKVRIPRLEKDKRKYECNQIFRKILPAPMKPSILPTSLLPLPVTSTPTTPTMKYAVTKTFKPSSQDLLNPSSVTQTGSYQVIKVPSAQQYCSDISTTDIPQVLCPTENVDDFCHNASLMLNSQQTQQLTSTSSDLSRLNNADVGNGSPIILLNPTSRVMLLNSSEVSSEPIYTLTAATASDTSIGRGIRRRIGRQKVLKVERNPIQDLSAIIKHTSAIRNATPQLRPITKFRKIAPLPATSTCNTTR